MEDPHKKYMKMAIDLSRSGMMQEKGGPFGCIIVKNGKVVGKGSNSVLETNDPTAHAEVVAIRDACKKLEKVKLLVKPFSDTVQFNTTCSLTF